MYLQNLVNTTVENILFLNNTSTEFGGGLGINDSLDLIGKNLTFINNTATSGGGAIYSDFINKYNISNVYIDNNQGYEGGGLHLKKGQNCNLTNFEIKNSYASFKGAGFFILDFK